jgi:hypothetical protein
MESKYSDDEDEDQVKGSGAKEHKEHASPLKKGESKEEKKEVDAEYLIDQLQKYFYEDNELAATFETYVKERSVIIDLDSEEYKLSYTEAYNEYKEMFEQKMEAQIVRLGYSPVEFYKVIKDKIEKDREGSVAIFAQILLGVTEFDIFMQMMREAARQFHSRRK